MNERMTRGVSLLYTCAALQLAGCMQGDTDAEADDEQAYYAQMDHAMVDGGMSMGDAGHAHPVDAGMHAHPDGGMHAHEEDEDGCGADHPTYRPGLSWKAGDLTVVVTKMVPAPPRQFANNDWTLMLFDKAGSPLTGAKITNADSYMKIHDHGGNTRPTVVELPAPGQFLFDNIDFKMRGPWEILFDVTPQGATRPVPVELKICVE